MKILVDMNLSPTWCPVLSNHGWAAVHWSQIGRANATDEEIMAWAVDNGYIVLTHDLDFGAVLAATKAQGPSVIQVRAQDVLPAHLEPTLVRAIKDHELALKAGALIVIDEFRSRVRVLPISH